MPSSQDLQGIGGHADGGGNAASANGLGVFADVSGLPPGLNGRARRGIPPKLYRIGEVVDYSGVSRQTIHNYTIMGLLRESKWTSGGHRLYDQSVFQRLDDIAAMKEQHRSLQEIRDHFARLDNG